MSREIKFRIAVTSDHWDDEPKGTTLVSTNAFTLGEMWDRVVELEFPDGGCLPFGDIDWNTDLVRYLQFTGLKDRNGEDIYEGDIVNALGGEYHEGCREYDVTGEIKWAGNGFDIMCGTTGMGWGFADGFDSIEIIGNVFENPELLEGK